MVEKQASPVFGYMTRKQEIKVFRGIRRDYDLKNELILYVDEDDNYNEFVYDVNTRTKTLVDIPKSFADKQKCTRNDYFGKTSYIKRVTNKYYFIAFEDCPSTVLFKVKKSK
ncbi:hypothetical protein [Flavobacterium sp. ACN6]|uniref:hypothetical protein n=1 Tax=Flavobacterium sp. ACN6 TaxID=1920426 RepID=UPI001144EE60|nr:hypothetical protein [Flavobacterium sp. ACN6]